jgi:hypothetical protein
MPRNVCEFVGDYPHARNAIALSCSGVATEMQDFVYRLCINFTDRSARKK